ncbi:hypothetical protein LUZ60_003592 [Juncus effusus]|nr:hypothetical protein LUZ60_003592 [Juncus effusus]
MASPWSFFSFETDSETEKEKEEAHEAYKKYEHIASTLPTLNPNFPFRKYEGFWYHGEFSTTTIAIQDTFKARTSDIILNTYPKSGTTWIKALIFTVINRKTYSFDEHPLLSYSPHDCFPFIHTLYESKSVPKKLLDSIQSPRLLATHIPFSSLPPSISQSGCHIIYLCRDPKDALVSLWHYCQKIFPDSNKDPISLEMIVNMACDGTSAFGPIWDHMLGYWYESLKRPDQVLFLKYEDMREDTGGHVRRLASFLGSPFGEQEERQGMVEKIVNFCGFEEMSGREVNKTGKHGVKMDLQNSAFFRKGAVGDWETYMSPEMARRVDAVMEEKLHGSGLSFSK